MPRPVSRSDSRLKILQAANRHIAAGTNRRGWTVQVFADNGSGRAYPAYLPGRLLSMRQLERAVCIARRNQLVSPTVLAAAGFNPEGNR